MKVILKYKGEAAGKDKAKKLPKFPPKLNEFILAYNVNATTIVHGFEMVDEHNFHKPEIQRNLYSLLVKTLKKLIADQNKNFTRKNEIRISQLGRVYWDFIKVLQSIGADTGKFPDPLM